MKIQQTINHLEFFFKAALSFFIRVCSRVLALVTAMVLTRILSPEDYGLYAVLFSIITLLSLPVREGGPDLLTRFVAAYLVKKEYGNLRGLLKTATVYVFLVSLVIISISVSAYSVFINSENYSFNLIMLSLLLIPLGGLTFVCIGALRGFHHVIWAQIPEFVFKPILVIAIVLCIFFITKTMSVQALFAILVSASLVTLLLGMVLYQLFKPKEINTVSASYEFKEWVITLLPMIASVGMVQINHNADIIMIGMFVDGADAGAYQVASRTAVLMMIMLSAVNAVMAPKLSQFHTESDYISMQALLKKAALVIAVVTIPFALALSYSPGSILSFLFGEDYAYAGDALLILLWGQVFNALSGSVGLVLIMGGYQKLAFYGVLLSTIANLLMNFILIPVYGIEGAATASAVSIVIWNVALSVFVWQKLRMNCTILPFGKY